MIVIWTHTSSNTRIAHTENPEENQQDSPLLFWNLLFETPTVTRGLNIHWWSQADQVGAMTLLNALLICDKQETCSSYFTLVIKKVVCHHLFRFSIDHSFSLRLDDILSSAWGLLELLSWSFQVCSHDTRGRGAHPEVWIYFCFVSWIINELSMLLQNLNT